MKRDATQLELPQPPIRANDSWQHQLGAYHFAMPREAAMLAMDMGTGKSKVAVDTICNRDCMTVLILCPKSVLNVWSREVAKHAGATCQVLVLDKGSTRRKAKEAADFFVYTGGQPRIVVVNYETARMKDFADFALSRNWDCVILDESHRIKTASSAVSKFAAKLASRAKFRLALTGTPMPHSPLDIYAQYRFLDTEIFGKSWHRFRNTYAVLKSIPTVAVKIVAGYQNQDDLQEKFAQLAYRVDKDVLDLPEVQHHKLTCRLSTKAQKIYAALEQDFIAEVEGGVVTAANALVKLLRLQQVTSGHVRLDDDEAAQEVDTAKRAVLLDLMEDLPPHEPAVVFCRFQWDLDAVRQVAEHLERSYGEISGRRKDLTSDATMPEDVQLMAVQIQSGGVGIDLTRARYAVYYSLGFSLGDYEQSLARIHRPGQTRPVNYYHIIAQNTVDERVYEALQQRRDIVNHILKALKPNGENCNGY